MESLKMCLLERFFRNNGFRLVHDGQHNPGQFQLAPEDVKCFTRKYRLQMDKEWLNTWVVFRYDERSQVADFEIYSKEPNHRGREKMILQMPLIENKEKEKDEQSISENTR